MCSKKQLSFYSLEVLNSVNRIDMAKQFCQDLMLDMSGWKLVDRLYDKTITQDELFLQPRI